MATSSSDVSESSDIVHEFPCKPCSDDGKNIEGVNFCAECQTYFCQACVQFHNKCFKTHTIFNRSGVKSDKLQFEKTQSGLACDKHAGYPIQMYCREHDTVCCAVCIAVDHRLCKSADFIPKLAKEILNGRDRNDVKTSLEGIRKQLNSMKAKKLQQIKDVAEEKDENLKEIVKMKEQIIARVEEMERNSVQQVQKKHDKIVRAIESDIDSIDVKLNAVQSNIEKVNAFKGDNEAKLFVVLNKAHEVEVSSSSFIDENGKGEYDKIDFVVSQDIATFVGKIDAFGNVKADEDREKGHTVATYSQIHVAEASIVSQVSVKGKDSCILDNGQIIILVNEGLIRLDRTYKMLDKCNLSGARYLCKAGPTEIIVLCNTEIIFVDAGKSLAKFWGFGMNTNYEDKKKIYPVLPNFRCTEVQFFGISVYQENLFVCVKLTYELDDYYRTKKI
ncbi:probable E3 ubiquitin-protein ligase MID2 [Ruditapes philippinarum]|uniref:probable E3 ubiquitin-protein ligase MID2 n=1 Tax=Ruditapes philippinarum TaxID=129788 RepID=UPI00295C0FE5|nr:probable E3 ubiquitin-protein ligase MID2 [Ruditapes philippinarum]